MPVLLMFLSATASCFIPICNLMFRHGHVHYFDEVEEALWLPIYDEKRGMFHAHHTSRDMDMSFSISRLWHVAEEAISDKSAGPIQVAT